MTRSTSSTTKAARPPARMVTTVALDRLYARMLAEGLCTQAGADDDRWMPESKRPRTTAQARELAAAADAACAGCPVTSECLTWAVMTGQGHGTWGGRAEHELAAMRAALLVAGTTQAPSATEVAA